MADFWNKERANWLLISATERYNLLLFADCRAELLTLFLNEGHDGGLDDGLLYHRVLHLAL